MDVKGSWKGRIWFLYFISPFILYLYFNDIDYHNLVGEELYIFILLIIISIAWIIGLYYLIKRVKKVIK